MSPPPLRSIRQAVSFALAAGLSAATGARATDILVPGQQPTIQAGINAAVNGDEVVLADGTYTGAGNVNCNFSGKLITVRSASGHPESCIIDCQSVPSTRAFVFNSGETSAAVLSGITMTHGTGAIQGGAISVGATSPTIINCRFISNQATTLGGAVWSATAANPNFTDCLFYDNHSPSEGGAVWLGSSGSSNPAFTNCAFVNNTSAGNGGAVGTSGFVAPTYRSCRFVANTSGANGGAVSFGGSGTATFLAVNSIFEMNVAAHKGGAAYSGLNRPLQFVNCTFSRNTANDASGGGACWIASLAVITLKNCIAWHDVPNELGGPAAQYVPTFCSIENGPVGTGDLVSDPLFVNPNGPDSIPGTLDDDFSVLAGSPCIDSAENAAAAEVGITVDLNGNGRFVDDPAMADTGWGRAPMVDRGCYEFQPLVVRVPCPGDLDGNGIVNGLDLAIVLGTWGPCPK